MPWLSYLIVGVFLAVQVPARVADSQWWRAGLLACGAAIFLALGVVATVRRRRASRERIVHHYDDEPADTASGRRLGTSTAD